MGNEGKALQTSPEAFFFIIPSHGSSTENMGLGGPPTPQQKYCIVISEIVQVQKEIVLKLLPNGNVTLSELACCYCQSSYLSTGMESEGGGNLISRGITVHIPTVPAAAVIWWTIPLSSVSATEEGEIARHAAARGERRRA